MLNAFGRADLVLFGQALVLMASADDHVTADERTAVTRVVHDVGLSVEDAEQIWRAPPTESAVVEAISLWRDEVLRRALLKDLLLVAYADGEFSPTEGLLLGRLRTALGLDASVQDAMEAWVRRGIAWQQEGLDLCLGKEGDR